jgi:hypothetical protein
MGIGSRARFGHAEVAPEDIDGLVRNGRHHLGGAAGYRLTRLSVQARPTAPRHDLGAASWPQGTNVFCPMSTRG